MLDDSLFNAPKNVTFTSEQIFDGDTVTAASWNQTAMGYVRDSVLEIVSGERHFMVKETEDEDRFDIGKFKGLTFAGNYEFTQAYHEDGGEPLRLADFKPGISIRLYYRGNYSQVIQIDDVREGGKRAS